ncbi:MAG: glycosyltransferase [Patescibacteria group bacterium]
MNKNIISELNISKKKLKMLYVNLGGVGVYCSDKTIGRCLGWVIEKSEVFLLIPQLIKDATRSEMSSISTNSKKVKIITLPFSSKMRSSGFGIIFSYFIRVLFSPILLFKNIPKFDVCYANSALLVDVIPILFLKLFGKCRHFILMIDSIVPKPSQRSGNIFINTITHLESKFVVKIISRFTSIIFTVNPELKKEIVKQGIDEKKIFLTQNGLFMDKINKVLARKEKIYDGVYMGRITENKGIFDLLSVWSGIIKIIPNAKLAVMGTGREDVVKKFLNKIKDGNLEENIDYFGYVSGNKKYEIFRSSKIFIFLSKVNADESWGISLMEALACGLPAITYDLAIYNHIYREDILQKNKIGDINSVINKIKFLLIDEDIRRQLRNKSIIFAEQFNWFDIAKRDLEIIYNTI